MLVHEIGVHCGECQEDHDRRVKAVVEGIESGETTIVFSNAPRAWGRDGNATRNTE